MKILKWKYNEKGEIYHKFFPIMLNKKRLIRIDENINQYNDDEYMPFTPISNYKIMDFIIKNTLYSIESIDSIATFRIGDKDHFYGAKIINKTGESIVKVYDLYTEKEAVFAAFYSYYHPNEIKEILHHIQEERKNQKNEISEKKGKVKNDNRK
ncbi:MAG: hypothetical protein WCK10_03905 [Candidatus Staskawiczbacteria bacterium]